MVLNSTRHLLEKYPNYDNGNLSNENKLSGKSQDVVASKR